MLILLVLSLMMLILLINFDVDLVGFKFNDVDLVDQL